VKYDSFADYICLHVQNYKGQLSSGWHIWLNVANIKSIAKGGIEKPHYITH
jgi:hypothetical protein